MWRNVAALAATGEDQADADECGDERRAEKYVPVRRAEDIDDVDQGGDKHGHAQQRNQDAIDEEDWTKIEHRSCPSLDPASSRHVVLIG